MLGDNPDDEPTHRLQHLLAPYVFDVLAPVDSMVITVVFDSDHAIFPAQIEVGEGNAVGAQHGYLRLWPGQTRIYEEQPKVALPG